MFLFFNLGTGSHVSFFSIWSNSSSIALIQCPSLLASSKLLGSTVDNNVRCCCSGESILLQVSTPVYLFPIICFGGWFFCTYRLGVLEGICCSSSWSCSTSVFSSSFDSSSTSSYFISSSLSYSFESLLLSFHFCACVSSIVTLILSTILLSLGLKNLYVFLFLNTQLVFPYHLKSRIF